MLLIFLTILSSKGTVNDITVFCYYYCTVTSVDNAFLALVVGWLCVVAVIPLCELGENPNPYFQNPGHNQSYG